MKNRDIHGKESDFRRLTGVKKATFVRMIEILKEEHASRPTQKGRRKNLSLEEQLFMTLEYLREYRTYFHIANNYGVSESTAYKTIRYVEDTLVKHPDFALPGRKALLKSDCGYEVVIVDATESSIERPKKVKDTTIQARKKDIL